MTNQEFCYWLQGFFEISQTAVFDERTAVITEKTLHQITEPLGEFTTWLLEVLKYFHQQQYCQETLEFFTEEIKRNLNAIFFHVIDNSYTEGSPPAEWQKIHDGESHHEK